MVAQLFLLFVNVMYKCVSQCLIVWSIQPASRNSGNQTIESDVGSFTDVVEVHVLVGKIRLMFVIL